VCVIEGERRRGRERRRERECVCAWCVYDREKGRVRVSVKRDGCVVCVDRVSVDCAVRVCLFAFIHYT
jgi:hypothetical protein